MGIRGLTTFIQQRSDQYMEEYRLHDTCLVIDGNSVACQLYKFYCKSHDCFGGDYDNYGKVITEFFESLFQCNITPYVILDGGYETRKIATIVSRMKKKIRAAENLEPISHSTNCVFPLFLRETFIDTALKLNVKMVRCDFEGDTDTANIARRLGCPVLSYDSDYFIFDVLYIPFPTLDWTVRRARDPKTKENFKFLACEVYKVEKFLCSYGYLDKSNLPLLAVLLGNDYVKRSVFSMFYQNLKMQNCSSRYNNDLSKRIKSVMIWLQNESKESAITKVLGRYKMVNRKKIAANIENAIKGYNCYDSIYLKYLSISPSKIQQNEENIDFDRLCQDATTIDEALEEDDEKSELDPDLSSDTDIKEIVLSETNSGERSSDFSNVFIENFRKCLYPSCFMDMYLRHKYYCIPQIENIMLENSHMSSLEIISAIHKILTNTNHDLICIFRVGRGVGRKVVPDQGCPLPSIDIIHEMDDTTKQSTFFKALNLDPTFVASLSSFPKSWQLFVIALKYAIDKSFLSWCVISSLILCKIILGCIDKEITTIRSLRTFQKRFGAKLNQTSPSEIEVHHSQNIVRTFERISEIDTLYCMQSLINYFQMDQKLISNRRLFDRNLVHSLSQFQSCLLHIKYLNCVLEMPFENVCVSDCLNCTFVYNLTVSLKKRTNVEGYLETLLHNSPTIVNSYYAVIGHIKSFSASAGLQNSGGRRRKRKKKKSHTLEENFELQSDNEQLVDPNNKYSILSLSST